MLFKKRNQKKLKRLVNYFSFIILASISIWYYFQLPKPIHWTVIVPWALSAVFLILWCLADRPPAIEKCRISKPKIKRYA